MLYLHIDTIHEDSNFRMKDREKALIFHTLYTVKSATRKNITDNLSMRPVTVSRIIRELIDDGLVLEGNSKTKNGKGRPEKKLYPDYHRFSAISIYVVSREIKGSLVNLKGEILATQSASVPEEAENGAITKELKKILTALIKKLPRKSQLVGVGTSLPGTVNGKEGRWISSARWPRLNNMNMTHLTSEFGLPLSLSRSLDPELEYLLFKNENYRRGGTLLFHWGYGIGSAFASEGKILKSSLGRFGEVGHWLVEPSSAKKCSCGATGCLETEAALWSILPEIRTVYPDAPEDEPDFYEFLQHKNIENLEIIKKALGYISVSLANLYKVFYPDRILLLGPFVNNRILYHSLKKEFFQKLPEYAHSSITLDVIPESQGSVSGSVYNLFRNALKPVLRMRGNV